MFRDSPTLSPEFGDLILTPPSPNPGDFTLLTPNPGDFPAMAPPRDARPFTNATVGDFPSSDIPEKDRT